MISSRFDRHGDCNDRSASAETDCSDISAQGGTTGSSLPGRDRIRREIRIAQNRQLSPYLAEWVLSYRHHGTRPDYLWKWCRHAVEVITLPSVSPNWRDRLGDIKTLGVMLDVMLDDLADQGGNEQLLEELLTMLAGVRKPKFTGVSRQERRYAEFTSQIWHEINRQAAELPRFSEFAPVWKYDYLQLGNVMRYAHLLNAKPELLNLTEHDLYMPHNMHIMICSTFDLMASPDFDRFELGKLREIIWHAQCMGRIGNLVTTWQRELNEGDFTSGVYARAVRQGDLAIDDLTGGDRHAIEQAIRDGRHEDHFLKRWHSHRDQILSSELQLRSFDVEELVAGLERLICLHLGSRGSK